MRKPNHVLIVFGRAPLFYFLAYLFLVNALTIPFPNGYDLCVVYVIWITVVAMMYPLCVWWTPGFSRVPRQSTY